MSQQNTLKGKQRTYGTATLEDGWWLLDVEPHVAMYARRVFERLVMKKGNLALENTPSVCLDLEWFLQRFPLEIEDKKKMKAGARKHRERMVRLDQILDPDAVPREFELALEARDYQRRGAELALAAKRLLNMDDVGTGKTCTLITGLTDPSTRPALIGCKPNLEGQILEEFQKFLPDIDVHIIRKTKPYPINRDLYGRKPEIFIISYSKLKGWQDHFRGAVRTVAFDEVQELRHMGTKKYEAAKSIADSAAYVWGLSATPIFNYGGEIWNVFNIVNPGRLGSKDEFKREWCSWGDRLKDAKALGSWLREQHLVLQRTRKDVGRELGPLTRVTHTVQSDPKVFDDVQDTASKLARIILEGQGKEAWKAKGDFDELIRQATGLAKAPYVAAFVDLLIENGEKVLLYGWHRAVYSVWMSKLAHHNPVMYTGSETPKKKQENKEKFLNGESPLLIMSLRSGSGVDGLQYSGCRTTVFGELDWSKGQIEQCIGRIQRDGQPDPVSAYFLVSETGADPIMQRVLGLKGEELEGIRDPYGKGGLEKLEGGRDIRALAESFLNNKGAKKPGSLVKEAST